MKFISAFSTLVAYVAVGALSMPSDSAAAECGALGVADWDLNSLPAGVDVKDLRKCKEHPLSLVSPNEVENSLEKRTCYDGPKSGGCSDGWCWKTCGSGGRWCWGAWNNGFGDWVKCKADTTCFGAFGTGGAACSQGSCKKCGCGC
ncbi:hypothetical protein B0T10DRAFT_549750 [Thelonectria olida]|uniref:IDI-2 n=1 Tax=Thelonectria olida TaxID=1576542 RepID=A0A9P8W404_9HYPO|nr:hypothetical protein B0T10DRAFT_549750 [Thelonectria olida]